MGVVCRLLANASGEDARPNAPNANGESPSFLTSADTATINNISRTFRLHVEIHLCAPGATNYHTNVETALKTMLLNS